VLGELLKQNLTRRLVISSGDVPPFFTRPVGGPLAAITIFSTLWSMPPAQRKMKAGVRGRFGRRHRPA
jgi:putative tricarboxylic transport membrane protein